MVWSLLRFFHLLQICYLVFGCCFGRRLPETGDYLRQLRANESIWNFCMEYLRSIVGACEFKTVGTRA
jgi:ABC-type polysaccharide/polyol phosphate export permease